MTLWKRRLRIWSDSPVSHMVQVKDLETGRVLPGVARIRIDIGAEPTTTAHLLMYKQDEHRQFVYDRGEPVTETRTIQEVGIDLLAMEPVTRAEIAQMFKDALFVEDAHHKQYYLWQIAEALGLYLDFDEDEAPPSQGVTP